ncbi:hypothetical protein LIER_29744 [Lithospermum erythrorhizon]|uniref:BHLH domain-containing protein n=1 Tax=Lithospermum erythrorhizon TaxID=34254 RepID=A0AAV3RM76_LITER
MSKGEVGGHEGYFLENEQVWEFANSDNSRTIEEELDNIMEHSLPSYTEEASEKGKETIKLAGKKRSRECSNSAKGSKGGDEKNDETRKSESDHDSHILTERERRKKMKTMFATLHSLLPHLSHKVI